MDVLDNIMSQDYESRLSIPLFGKKINLFTKSHELIAISYNRIVIGNRGPYIEFQQKDIILDNIYIPELEKYRLTSNVVFYYEYRTNIDNVKIYYQVKTVNYADYKIGMYYISPFDLYDKHSKVLIKPIRNKCNKHSMIDLLRN
jgi:hypothetical protein